MTFKLQIECVLAHHIEKIAAQKPDALPFLEKIVLVHMNEQANIAFPAKSAGIEKLSTPSTIFGPACGIFKKAAEGSLKTWGWSTNMDLYLTLFKNKKHEKKKVHIFEQEDRNGTACIFAATFLKNGEWLLVYQQHMKDALRILRQTEKKTVLVLFAIGFCTLLISILCAVILVHRTVQGRYAPGKGRGAS